MFPNLAKFFRRRARDISRFRAAQQGATVVEFALIAPAFIACLFAIIQTTLFLFAQQVLQTAAVEAGRIMTGQSQNSNVSQNQFATNVCPLVQALFTCSKLMVNVQAYNSFSGANAAAPSLTYNANGQSTIPGHTVSAAPARSWSCSSSISGRSSACRWGRYFPILATAPPR